MATREGRLKEAELPLREEWESRPIEWDGMKSIRTLHSGSGSLVRGSASHFVKQDDSCHRSAVTLQVAFPDSSPLRGSQAVCWGGRLRPPTPANSLRGTEGAEESRRDDLNRYRSAKDVEHTFQLRSFCGILSMLLSSCRE